MEGFVRLTMNWTAITSVNQVVKIKEESSQQPIMIFKHSTRCSISRAALDRLERNWNQDEVPYVKPYFLDLLTYREISNQIEEVFEIEHESPQILIIRNGKTIFNRSHFEIDFAGIKQAVSESLSKN